MFSFPSPSFISLCPFFFDCAVYPLSFRFFGSCRPTLALKGRKYGSSSSRTARSFPFLSPGAFSFHQDPLIPLFLPVQLLPPFLLAASHSGACSPRTMFLFDTRSYLLDQFVFMIPRVSSYHPLSVLSPLLDFLHFFVHRQPRVCLLSCWSPLVSAFSVAKRHSCLYGPVSRWGLPSFFAPRVCFACESARN